MTSNPFRFFDLHVLRTERLSPSMARITLGGEDLDRFADGGRDQRFKLFLPQPGQEAPVLPDERGDGWFPAWQAQDPAVRSIMRSYTVSALRQDPLELDIDFALHGTTGGPAGRWALAARPGDRISVFGPAVADNGGVDFRPPPGTDWNLITGDETAIPAVAGILDWLPAGTPAKVWIEVAHPDDRRPIPTEADAEITWLVRDPARPDRCRQLVDAVRAAELPEGTPYAWIAGESGTVKALRRHLVSERGFDRKAVKFTGYWKLGVTEEDLIAEAIREAAEGSAAGEADEVQARAQAERNA
ncbi:siderophore-interacting protein [Streptomyces sp. H27-D2]|uniref:siderophore-interacting protein n=1 Tax=Streptomyces sp. H27-D2 TaxID=3046304 RepID=UPI002DB76250|nr:siderophore-interacting protein [Streptomyces sp. H27-D2]MEC4020854.1 siderophore-interacting protein [Streptomyces sp. H27-D2]